MHKFDKQAAAGVFDITFKTFSFNDAFVHFYEDLLNACRYLEEFIALE